MSNTAAVTRARRRVDRITTQRDAAVDVLHCAMFEAYSAGSTVIEIAAASGYSRPHVYTVLEEMTELDRAGVTK